MAFVEALWNYYSATIGTIISSILILITFIVYTYRNIVQRETKENSFLHLVTNITLFLLFWSSTLNAIDYLVNISPTHCKTALFIVWLIFGYYKGCLYIIYVSRLHLVYNNTGFAINRYLLYSMITIVALYFVIILFVCVNAVFIAESFHYIEEYTFCTLNLSTSSIIYFGFMDVIFPLFCLILFIKPIIRLQTQTLSDTDVELNALAVKYTVITFTAVMSSVFIIIFVAFFGIWPLVPIDYIINCICVVLYDSRYKWLYKILCKYCDSKTKQNKTEFNMNPFEIKIGQHQAVQSGTENLQSSTENAQSDTENTISKISKTQKSQSS